MTRLPVDSWEIEPLFALEPYDLNTICPVTGEVSGLEDHHIFRRSFTGLGQDNRHLFWVAYTDMESGDQYVVKNRVALSPEAHLRITTNVARLEYRKHQLWYIEDGEEKPLDLDLHLMAKGETVSKRRRGKQASTPEERKARVNYTVRTPKDEENILPELIDLAREKLVPKMGWDEDVPAYFVLTAVLSAFVQEN